MQEPNMATNYIVHISVCILVNKYSSICYIGTFFAVEDPVACS